MRINFRILYSFYFFSFLYSFIKSPCIISNSHYTSRRLFHSPMFPLVFPFSWLFMLGDDDDDGTGTGSGSGAGDDDGFVLDDDDEFISEDSEDDNELGIPDDDDV